MADVHRVDHLFSMCEALHLTPNTFGKKPAEERFERVAHPGFGVLRKACVPVWHGKKELRPHGPWNG